MSEHLCVGILTSLLAERWSEVPVTDLFPEEMAVRLIDWYNIREGDLNAEDLTRLAELVIELGAFETWECPRCRACVYEGSPDDWSGFQGVIQNDRTSYPGNGPDDRRCDHCRCYHTEGP
jgi:hypothetical protein